jgi:hypothetical protein
MVMGVPAKVRRAAHGPRRMPRFAWYSDNYVRYRLDFADDDVAAGRPA